MRTLVTQLLILFSIFLVVIITSAGSLTLAKPLNHELNVPVALEQSLPSKQCLNVQKQDDQNSLDKDSKLVILLKASSLGEEATPLIRSLCVRLDSERIKDPEGFRKKTEKDIDDIEEICFEKNTPLGSG